jgi:hypothetical protein
MAVSRLSQQSIQQSFPKGNTLWDGTTNTSAYDSLGSVLVPSGGLATITFSNIPQTYTHLQIRLLARGTNASTGGDLSIQFNGDTASNYTYHQLYGDGSSTAANSGANQTITYGPTFTGANAPANVFGVGITDLLDYANTNKFKTIRTLSGQDQNGVNGFVNFRSGLWRSTSAISSMVLVAAGGNFVQHSQLSLYGIK